MKRLLLAGTSACCLLGAASAVQAQEGFYVGGAGGFNFAEDLEMGDVNPCCGPGDREIDFDDGFAVLGALGYMFASGFRVEGEASYRENDVDSVTVQGEGTTPRSGDVGVFALMANGWYDIEVVDNVQIHLGGGIGVGFLSADVNDVSVFGPTRRLDDNATVFAYQLGGGVAYVLDNGVAFTADYRFFGTTDPDLDVSTGGGNVDADADGYHSHSILFGIRMPLQVVGVGP
ncbi:MAG: outer membrane protein [Hyphomicrobiales bacterium]